jgi:hypothetical protein
MDFELATARGYDGRQQRRRRTMATSQLKPGADHRPVTVPLVMTVFIAEGRMYHARCRSAIDFRGSRGGLELDFYCRVCREHVHLPEHALARVGSDPEAGERPTAMKASPR